MAFVTAKLPVKGEGRFILQEKVRWDFLAEQIPQCHPIWTLYRRYLQIGVDLSILPRSADFVFTFPIDNALQYTTIV